jgi:hypothetical protein
MKTQKWYKNGKIYDGSGHKEVREILIRHGIKRKISNFGPFLQDRNIDKNNRLIDSFIFEGYEFSVIEYECMTLSWDFQSVSEPHLEKMIWYQPCE